MKKMPLSLTVQGCEISVASTTHGDYISLTDLAKCAAGESANLVGEWLKNKNTLEYLGGWEGLYNADFNSIEFDGIISASGTNRYTLSVKEWVTRTGAIGILAKTGRYDSGTFAHEDIALDFAAWLSPAFRLYVHKEFKRLKEAEAADQGGEWSIKRVLSKANYHVHTDAIKEVLIPAMKLRPSDEWIAYTTEADMLNQVVFGMSAKEWRDQNPQAKRGENMRDHARTLSLTVLSNLESLNATLMRDGMTKMERFYKLSEVARQQFESLSKSAALRERAKQADSKIKALNAPQTPSAKPPATGAELKSKFAEMKETVERIVRVPPPKPGDKKK